MRPIRKLSSHMRGGQLHVSREMLAHLEVLPGQQVYVTLEPAAALRIRALDRVPREELESLRPGRARAYRRAVRAALSRRAALLPRSAPEPPRTAGLAGLFAQTRRQLGRRLYT